MQLTKAFSYKRENQGGNANPEHEQIKIKGQKSNREGYKSYSFNRLPWLKAFPNIGRKVEISGFPIRHMGLGHVVTFTLNPMNNCFH